MTTVAELNTLISTLLTASSPTAKDITATDVRTVAEEMIPVLAEIIAARGNKPTLRDAIRTQLTLAGLVPYIVGRYYGMAYSGGVGGGAAGAAGRVDLVPFVTRRDMKIDRLALLCTTGVASAVARVAVYDANAAGEPTTKLYETASLSLATTNTAVEETVDLTFPAGVLRWIGVWYSSTAQIRLLNASSSLSMGPTSNAGTGYRTVLRRTVTFTGNLPTNWGFVESELTSVVNVPDVRFRIAA